MITHQGSCHCGWVRLEVDAPPRPRVFECNCSMCSRVGYLHLIVPAERFRLLSGNDRLSSYRFNTLTANHLFCERCGVKAFYVPRSHPDGYSVNARCLDDVPISELEIEAFDGANWEANVEELPGR